MSVDCRRVVICVAFAVVLLVPRFADAQVTNETLGLVAGLNSSTLVGPVAATMGRLAGGVFGASATGSLTGPVGFEIDALFSQKGVTSFGSRASDELRINYLDVPVLLRISTAGEVRAYGLVGPTISFKLGSTETYNGAAVTTWKDSDIKGTDLGFTAGIGLAFGRFDAAVRGTWGLASIDASTSPADIKNMSFTALIGFRFMK